MVDSDDEFGDGLDDEDMLLVATHAEQAPSQDSNFIDTRPSKRQDTSEPQRAPSRTIGGLDRLGRYSDGRGSSLSLPFEVGSQSADDGAWNGEWRLRGPQSNLKQTTLFGALSTTNPEPSPQQADRRHNWPLATKGELPTHHKLDHDELRTWVYPTNIGSIRDYQYNIVARGLYHNLLVALPTGLGKTFIAATIMLNWYRWTKESKIVFVAPTRPLVAQQVEACFGIAGIPRSSTSMLTGGIAPGIRAEEWRDKRVFFMTPQTIINDLKTGICDPKSIVLLVVDEAHRATGAYAYVEVVKFMRRFNTSFRVLALTATPGSTVEGVQEVIDGLGISRVEIRTEESLDIRKYVHQRNIETTIFEYSEELLMCMDLFSKALQPLVNKVKGLNAYWSHNPLTLTAYGCTQARMKWLNSDVGRRANWGVKGVINSVFPILASFAHALELLKFHGIGPFYQKLLAIVSGSGESKSKNKRDVLDSEPFRTLMSRVQTWMNDRDFVGHPKLEALRSVALNHFMDAGEGRQEGSVPVPPSQTRIMVFAHFRDSAEEIVRVLKRNEPMVRPHVFVGQANANGSAGMDQKTQLDIIEKFRSGIYNTLVATSIGEEGLDIGEVDLIVCYDGSASPIRMLQRMGRTGRKRVGKIEVLLMKDKEYDNFLKAKDNYEKMQEMIASGKRFTFHDELSPRIVPRDAQPVPDKRIVEIPVENTQTELPVPKRTGRAPKRPPKKFHLPDNAQLGFTTAGRLVSSVSAGGNHRQKRGAQSPTFEPVPTNEEVFLTAQQTRELESVYQSVSGEEAQIVEPPRLDRHAEAQRQLRPTAWITHSYKSRLLVKMLGAMHEFTDPFASIARFERHLHPDEKRLVDEPDIPASETPSNKIEESLPNHSKHSRPGRRKANSKGSRPPQSRHSKAEHGIDIDLDSATEDDEMEGSLPTQGTQNEARYGISLGSDTEGEEIEDDPRYASDLADFIDDAELSEDINMPSSTSSMDLLAMAESDRPKLSDLFPSQISISTDTPDLDNLLGRHEHDETALEAIQGPAFRKRRRALIESESEDSM